MKKRHILIGLLSLGLPLALIIGLAVALAAMQGSRQIVQEQNGQISALQDQINELEACLTELEGNKVANGAAHTWDGWPLIAGLLVMSLVLRRRRKTQRCSQRQCALLYWSLL